MQASLRKARLLLTLVVALVAFAISLQMGLNSNFVAQDMRLSGLQQGMLESVRESCGILALLVLCALSSMSEPRIGSLVLLMVGAGLCAYSFVGSFGSLLLASFVWSQGLHVWMPLPSSMAMALAEKNRAGAALGRLGSAGAFASALAIGTALLLIRAGIGIRPLWLLAGSAACIAALLCLLIPREIKAPSKRLVIRRKYGLFYLLQFLEGWRKQIFLAFAGFMLVKQHGTPVETLLLLFLTAQGLSWLAAPMVGRVIDRYGERPLLLSYYCCMAGVFVAYATVQTVGILYGLFVLDSVLFVCTLALTTYVGRLAPPEEHTPTLSAGVAANHIASFLMPLVGGLLWQRFGYQWAFVAGAAVALLTLIPVLLLPARAEIVKTAKPSPSSST